MFTSRIRRSLYIAVPIVLFLSLLAGLTAVRSGKISSFIRTSTLGSSLASKFPAISENLAVKAEFTPATELVVGRAIPGFTMKEGADAAAAGPEAPAGLKPTEQKAWLARARRDQAAGRQTTLKSFFPASYRDPFVVEGEGMRIVLRSVGAEDAKAAVEGGRIIYPDVYPATDSLHAVKAGRSEEFLYLRSSDAPRRFGYELSSVSGATRVALEAGAVKFRDAAGRELQIEKPWVIDATGRRSDEAVRWELGEAAADGTRALGLVVEPAGLTYPLVIDPSWTATGSLITARYNHTATLLTNGKVLVVGGTNGSALASAELYDPTAGTWSATGSLTTARFSHTATILADGKVLVAGGYNGGALASAEVYDPVAGTWSATGSLTTARYFHTATMLGNGKVLVACGRGGSALASAELYDPTAGTWSATGSTSEVRFWHTATLLGNGKVLVAGGYLGSSVVTSGAELYDPTAGTWSATGSLGAGRYYHAETLLANGKVLVAGGYAASGNRLDSSELYDPTAGTWSATGLLSTTHSNFTLTRIDNGKVLAAGGVGGDTVAELYDPNSGNWNTVVSLNTARNNHTATLLPNGKVLVAGGTFASTAVAGTEIYDNCLAVAISSQPTNQAACAGATVSFSVGVTGDTPYTYQWRKGGNPLTDVGTISGSATATLTITGIVAGDVASYDVVVTNACGTVTSNAATLTLIPPPGIAMQPVSQSVCTGSTAIFSVTPSGTGPFTYQWRKNGNDISFNSTSDTYSVVGASQGNAGDYDVVISNACGSTTSNVATLTVKDGTSITGQPSSQTVCAGSPASFSVTASGTGLSYQWRKGGNPIGGATGSTYSIASTTAASAGSYDVMITGSCGNLTSSPATLTVNSAPDVTDNPNNRSTTFGSTVSFSASADGTPTPSIVWQVSTGGGGFSDIPGATSSPLVLSNVTLAQSGNRYRAIFTNSCGVTFTGAATLTVTPAPTTTTIASSGPSVYGQAATFTATVVSGSNPVTSGTVTFRDGATNLGSAPLDGSGQAGISVSTLGAGSHTITADYSGTGNYLSSTSPGAGQSVSKATLTVTATDASKVYGAPVNSPDVSYSGFVNGDTAGVLSGSPSVSTTATAGSPVGPYPLTPSTGTLSAANYNFTFVSGTLTVTRAVLTVQANNASRVYGAADPAFTYSISGFVNGDTVGVVSGTPTLVPGATVSSPAGSYAIVPSLGSLGAANYSFAFANGTLTVNKALLIVQANNASRGYGAADPAFTYIITGFVNGDTAGVVSGTPVLTTTATASSPVGSYPLVPDTSGLGAANYNFTASNGILTVTQAVLTVTADSKSKAYGAALPTLTVSYSGFVNGDSQAALSGAPDVATTATASSNAGSYPITAAAGTLASPNYNLVFANGTLTVTPATLTVTADNKSKAYGAALPALTVSYSGFVNGDTAGSLSGAPSVSTTAVDVSGVGNYPITVTAGSLSSPNYVFAFTNGTLTVTPAALTIKADDKSKAYGAALPAFTATYSGFVNGDTESVLGGALSLTTTATASSGAGAYPITPGGVAAANYTIIFVNGALTVTQAVLTVTADSKSKAYGAALPTLTVSYSGFVNGDSQAALSGAPDVATTATASSNAGSYPITAAAGTLASPNYNLVFANGTLTVTPATLTVTADNKSKAYGAALPALTVSYSGFVNGDTAGSLSGAPSVSTTAQADSNAGSYPITVTAGSLSSPNYAFTFAGGTLTISKAALSVRADDKSKAYGAALPTLTVSYSGFVNGDSQAALSGAPDVATTATASSNAGSYPITAAAGTLSSPNYDFTFANGTLTVTQVPLTVTADNKSKAYGTALPALTVSYSGFVNGDTAGSLTGTPGLTTTATAGSGVGSYPITAAAGSLGSANYNFVFADGTLTVAPVALTIKADNKSKAYGAALPAFTATYTGFVNGDTESVLGGTLNLTTTATASSDAGAYPITPGGVTAANYTINFANGTLTVTMANAAINAVANNSSPVIGQSVTFTATINAVGGGAGATGTVTFKDGATVLGTGTLNGSGQATFTTSGLAVGSHSITAEYGGDTNYSAATSPVLDLTVNKASTTTTVASSANPSTVDQAVTFTATVTSSSSGTPSGSVEFFDGTTSLGTATLSGGSATVTTSTLTVGDHSITAVHSGDATFAGSTSVALAQKVNAACTYTLSKTTQMSDASGGTYSVTVTTRSDCAWTAVSNVSWIQITSGASGTGDGTVTYTVAPLDTVTMRTGTLTIAGQTLTVTQSRTFTLVSAASYDGTAIANDEILAGFGNGISSVTDTAMSLPLPTSLGEVQIKFKDSAGAERFAELLFVSPLQINFVTPPDLAYGTAMVTVINGGTEIAAGTVEVAAVAPSFFSVNSSGSGLAAALALRVKPDGSQSYESIAEFDAGQNVFVPVPIDIGSDPNAATDEVFLVMFGTGLRHRTSQENVTVKIGGVDAEVLYAAEQPTFRGEDQVNIRIPRSLIGRGEVDVVVTVDGKAANTVKINIR